MTPPFSLVFSFAGGACLPRRPPAQPHASSPLTWLHINDTGIQASLLLRRRRRLAADGGRHATLGRSDHRLDGGVLRRGDRAALGGRREAGGEEHDEGEQQRAAHGRALGAAAGAAVEARSVLHVSSFDTEASQAADCTRRRKKSQASCRCPPPGDCGHHPPHAPAHCLRLALELLRLVLEIISVDHQLVHVIVAVENLCVSCVFCVCCKLCVVRGVCRGWCVCGRTYQCAQQRAQAVNAGFLMQ